MLPDGVLLAIFDFCGNEDDRPAKIYVEAWQSLVHVCQRWRSVVFGSPRRLKLRLFCTNKTPARDMLDVWPPLPLVIRGWPTEGVGNIVAALERRDRVDRIELFGINGSPWENVLAAMQEPFPELILLRLSLDDETVPVVPDSFLGRSVPRLRVLGLDLIPFPGLPKLLLSATNLVHLQLSNIPHSGYISPDAMVTSLSSLTSLELLSLEFQSPRSHPDWASRHPPRPTRSVLPALTDFSFKGACEYFNDLVAGIDGPQLNNLSITFFNDIVFDAPRLIQFISRTSTLKALKNPRVVFGDRAASVNFLSQTPRYGSLEVGISCTELDWQISSVERVCTSCLPPLSTSEDLYISQDPYSHPYWQDNIENTLWLELLHPFTAVKNLYLCKEFAPRIVPVLQELVGGGTTEVLPALQNIFLEELGASGPGIQQFVAMRQVTSHPVAVSHWETYR
jgi:hypothetical protein